MRVTVEISREECAKWRAFFKHYGTAQPLLTETGMHRATLTGLLKNGRATKDVVDKVRSYVIKQNTELYGKR